MLISRRSSGPLTVPVEVLITARSWWSILMEKLAPICHTEGNTSQALLGCSECQEMLPADRFYVRSTRTRGYTYRCKSCTPRRKNKPETNRKHRYGISQDRYEEILGSQNGVCAICKGLEPLVVDHNHATGVVRGLLCHACNRGLGQFKDNISTLQTAIDYLN
jgi:hypothetical protein